jgi:hypothetical protein
MAPKQTVTASAKNANNNFFIISPIFQSVFKRRFVPFDMEFVEVGESDSDLEGGHDLH